MPAIVKKDLRRISSGKFENLEVIESGVSPQNNLIAFKTPNGTHYVLRKRGTSHDFFKDAQAAVKSGGSLGALSGSPRGPKGMVTGAAFGTLLYFLAELALSKANEHLDNAKPEDTLEWCYVNEQGTQVYDGPIKA